jgi:hypothetical protein
MGVKFFMTLAAGMLQLPQNNCLDPFLKNLSRLESLEARSRRLQRFAQETNFKRNGSL